MVKATIARVLARRKIEAAMLGATAAFSAAGLARRDDPQLPISAAVASVVRVADKPVEVRSRPKTPLASRPKTPLAMSISTASGRGGLDLPNLEHPLVNSWIKRFTGPGRGSFATYLSRMDKYEGMISKKLAARRMPQDLIYLAMIESGFNPTAKSPVSARGLWQFMGPTARQYGLKIGRKVDERTNPARSTDAALTYLSSLHKRFGSWYLAAAAYNTGQGRVARIMKQVTGRTKGTDADYYRISSRLPQETRDYVPKMIAAARIGNNPEKYGFGRNGD